MSLPQEVDVLIVGAGPAGLACACSLLANGVPAARLAIADARLEHEGNYSRALVVHAKTLEMMERISCADAVVSAGLPRTHIAFNSLASGPLITYDTSVLNGKTKYPFACVIGQSDTELVLYARLKELLGEGGGGDVHWGQRAESVRETPDGWKVARFQGGEEVRARYVVGADGSHSIVRQAAGIPYPDPYDKTARATGMPADLDHPGKADEVFCLADVRVAYPEHTAEKHLLPKEGVNAYLSPHGPSLWIPFGDNLYRLVGQIMDGQEAPAVPSKEYMQRMLDTRYPSGGITITSLVWSSRFYVKFRLADRYFEEHVPGSPVLDLSSKTGLAIVGDAAHVHSPMGGQGMNLGIRDSIYLGEALAHCLSPQLSTSEARALLKRWSDDRHAAGKRVISLAGGITFFGANSATMVVWLRDWALWLVGCIPGLRSMAVWMLSGLGEKGGVY
ncbi:FAD/NAD(P)-binding domain-containing protein [Calocera viscosa TUFC12733]|uniref:FAD/NAD(P)-binding domain-containing protein n=1 Tax=Calocera viscosa (strain TUFC12733) TaxID=1330018 RepID=A0A167KQJ0_CALVF|nr:FAD/NAD(P)-binding domain-containing protein [Calocera viscosa TUFC12733]